ncbi:MAG: cytochrome C [Acidobacteria bacterium]|nr:MAG: cytochrome C [Acidobacteriota bacterium]
MAKKKWLILPALLLMIQVFRPERSNPEAARELSLAAAHPPAQVQQLFQSACFNCHSNQTVWPWYSEVAPFAWLIADDVKRGRRALNFSQWMSYDLAEKGHLLKETLEVLEEGEMPPWYYRLVHSNARLSPAQVASLTQWAEQERQKVLTQETEVRKPATR